MNRSVAHIFFIQLQFVGVTLKYCSDIENFLEYWYIGLVKWYNKFTVYEINGIFFTLNTKRRSDIGLFLVPVMFCFDGFKMIFRLDHRNRVRKSKKFISDIWPPKPLHFISQYKKY